MEGGGEDAAVGSMSGHGHRSGRETSKPPVDGQQKEVGGPHSWSQGRRPEKRPGVEDGASWACLLYMDRRQERRSRGGGYLVMQAHQVLHQGSSKTEHLE